MKIQRILQASKTTEGREHQIILCYTSRKEFVVWSYFEDTKYSGGCYHLTFLDGLRDFRKHVKDTFGERYGSFDYVVQQIGQAEIVWEELDNESDETSKRSQVDLFLRKLQTVDIKSYNTIRDGIASLMLGLGLQSERLTLWKVHRLCAEIEDDVVKKKWDGNTTSGSPYFEHRREGLSHNDVVARIEGRLITVWELENLDITGNAHHDRHILSGCHKILMSSCTMGEKISTLKLLDKVMGAKEAEAAIGAAEVDEYIAQMS